MATSDCKNLSHNEGFTRNYLMSAILQASITSSCKDNARQVLRVFSPKGIRMWETIFVCTKYRELFRKKDREREVKDTSHETELLRNERERGILFRARNPHL